MLEDGLKRPARLRDRGNCATVLVEEGQGQTRDRRMQGRFLSLLVPGRSPSLALMRCLGRQVEQAKVSDGGAAYVQVED